MVAASCYRPRMRTILVLSLALASSLACGRGARSTRRPQPAPPTAADAKTFLDTVNDTMLRLGIAQSQAGWVQQNFITDDTEALDARANQAAHRRGGALRQGGDHASTRSRCRPTSGGSSNLLKVSLVLATPSDPKEAEELTQIVARLECGAYGKGKWCPDPAKPDDLPRTSTT